MLLAKCGTSSVSLDHLYFTEHIALLNMSTGSDRPLPKQQLRGAVIILGMLALARRSVVADHVEVLVKIGLVRKGHVCRLECSLIRVPLLIRAAERLDVSEIHMHRAATSKRQCQESQRWIKCRIPVICC